MTDVRQLHYRYRTDTGTVDATPTWGAGEDANYAPGSANFRLRVALRNAAAAATGSQPWELYVSKNGGAYSAVTTSSTNGVQSVDAGSSADDAALLVPRLYPFSPDWQLSGAAIDLDFAGDRIYPNGAQFTDYLSISRASIGYAKTAAGMLTQFGNDTLRITSLGLLVEDARTNSLTYSEDFSQSSVWVLNAASLASGQNAPNGATTAFKLTADTNNTNHDIQETGVSVTGTVAFTVFMKAAGYGFGHLTAIDGGGDARYSINVNLTTGTITDTHTRNAPTLVSSAVETFSDGWFRLQIVLSGITTNSGIKFGVSNSATPTWGAFAEVTFAGDNTNGVYIFGAQVEAASFGSSYIPTTTTSATRAADVVTNIGTLSIDIAAATGSIIAQIDNGEVSGVAANIIDSNGTNLLGFDATNHGLASISATLATGNTANRTTQDKLGIGWNGSGRSLVLNGGTVATDATAQTPNATQHIGSSGSDKFAYAYIERLTVWTSKIADATLQSLTAP